MSARPPGPDPLHINGRPSGPGPRGGRPEPTPPGEATALVDPVAMAEIRAAAARAQHRPARGGGRPLHVGPHRVAWGGRYTMIDPDLGRRHRRAARLAAAPLAPWVLLTQVVAPVVVLAALGWAAGGGLMALFDNPFVGRDITVGMLTGLTTLVGVALVAAQWNQGRGLARHVRTVRGKHAAAMRAIEAACRIARRREPSLPALDAMWLAQFDPSLALRTARSLAVLPDEEDVRVLTHLARGEAVDLGPGNVTMLESFVDPDRD